MPTKRLNSHLLVESDVLLVLFSIFQIYFADSPVMQTRGIGTILGIIDSTYFASQILSSVIMGYVMLLFESTLSYIVISLFLSVCSLFFINRLVINRHQLQ